MIFVTLGSQKFQFNRLLKKVDELIADAVIEEEVFAQTGSSDYQPIRYKYKEYLDREEFSQMEQKADIVITHGGTGTIIGAVKKGKKVIAVPRLAKFGEHVDDHQLELLQQFDEMNIIEVCYDLENLKQSFERVKVHIYKMYESNTEKILNSIASYLDEVI